MRKFQQTLGDDGMRSTQIKEWCYRFKYGRTLAAKSKWCCFLLLPWHCATRIRIRKTNSYVGVLYRRSPSPVWCSSFQEIRSVCSQAGISITSWSILPIPSHFPGKERHSCSLSSILADMASSDLRFCPEVTSALKGKHLDIREDIMQKATSQKGVPGMTGSLGLNL